MRFDRGPPPQRLERKRGLTADYAKFISEENEEATRYIKSDLARGRPSTGANPYVPGRKILPKGKPNNNTADNTQNQNHHQGAQQNYAAKGAGKDNSRTQPNHNAVGNPVWIHKGGRKANANLRGN